MSLVWPITALYFGPIGLWTYWDVEGEKDEAASDVGRSGLRGLPGEGVYAREEFA
jgi:hypothetical protein